MKRVPFAKMQGAGNDFVVVDCMGGDPVEDWTAFARRVLDRHFGVGGDQLWLVQPSDVAEFRMGIRNADGNVRDPLDSPRGVRLRAAPEVRGAGGGARGRSCHGA